LTNGGVISPLASYQYLEDFSSAALTNGGIMSPIVSYQYYEWPGNGILNLLSSPVVSYYYQLAAGSGAFVLHGRVTDAHGAALASATVSAMVLLTPAAQATTDGSGNYQMSALGLGVYDLWASDSTYQTSIRALTLNANTAEQNFQLNLLPPTPATLQVDRSATVNYTVGDLMGSQLLIFDGASFVPITANHSPSPNLMTIVMTHGWVDAWPDSSSVNKPFDRWPGSMAVSLQARGVTPSTANILAWDWRYAAMFFLDPGVPADRTPSQGVALGEALQQFLGASYSQPLHFIGHSLGTLVNASAIDYVHGVRIGTRDHSPNPWQNNLVHVTLFDQAQLAETGGLLPLYQSVLPLNFTWADNYASLVGLASFPNAVNVFLQKAALTTIVSSPLKYILSDTHGYPISWYGMTITTPIDPYDTLGFKRSYEYAPSLFPPSDIPSGSIYHQAPLNYDELALEPLPALEAPFGLLPDVVVQAGVDTIQYSSGVVVNVVDSADSQIIYGFNYVSGVAAQGEQAVVDLANASALQFLLTTHSLLPLGLPGQDKFPPPPIRPNGGGSSNAPPMVWLPVLIPANAAAMAFDFSVSGDPVDDALVCGIGTNNLFSLQAKYIPTNTVSATRLIDVSAWAGKTNELFLGFMGGTSTNATLEVENIRFYSLQPPSLSIQVAGGTIVLTWPSTAGGYALESTPTLTGAGWQTITNAPAVSGSFYAMTNAAPAGSMFYRLRKQ
jgi:hypothetical protein